MRILALAATLASGCALYVDDDEAQGELELGAARGVALPARWADRVAMVFELEPLTRTVTSFGTPESLPLPAPTSLRLDGRLTGEPLDLEGVFVNAVEGDCVISAGAACSGSTCFVELSQSNIGVCTFSLRGIALDDSITAGRCYTVARFHGGIGNTADDQAFVRLHSGEAVAARDRCLETL